MRYLLTAIMRSLSRWTWPQAPGTPLWSKKVALRGARRHQVPREQEVYEPAGERLSLDQGPGVDGGEGGSNKEDEAKHCGIRVE
jgi:hypothetical protein